MTEVHCCIVNCSLKLDNSLCTVASLTHDFLCYVFNGDVYIGNVFLQFQERTHETVPFTVHSFYRTCDIYQCNYHFGHATFYQCNYHFGYFVGELSSQVGRRATMSYQEKIVQLPSIFSIPTH